MAHCVGSNDVRRNIICIRYFSFGADRNKMILFLLVIRKIERNYNYKYEKIAKNGERT